jgi:surface polysaccharide O-acyltransferase-like enzyme
MRCKVKEQEPVYVLFFWIPIVKICAEKYPVKCYIHAYHYCKKGKKLVKPRKTGMLIMVKMVSVPKFFMPSFSIKNGESMAQKNAVIKAIPKSLCI